MKQIVAVKVMPSTPPGTTQRISLKVGPKGITSINTFNFVSNEQQPQPVLVKTITKPNYMRSQTPIQITSTNNNDSPNTPNSSGSPVLYRTELTIMPFNPNQSSSQSNINVNNTQTSQSAASTKKIHKF